MSVDTNGNAVAVWVRFDGSTGTCCNRVQAAYKPAGGPWGTVQTISAAGQDAFEPRVEVDSDGDAVAAWTRSDGSNLRVQAASRAAGAGTTFGAAQTLSAAGQDAFSPDVTIEPDGDAIAVWTRYDGSDVITPCCSRIQAASRPAGGSFGTVDTLSGSGVSAFTPKVDVDPSGNAVAVWYRENGGVTRVQSAVLREGNYARPQGASAFRVGLVIAYKQCNLPGNRTHGPTLTYASCNPPVQESDTLTVGTTDANGVPPQSNGSVKITVCPAGTTGSGTCATPVGMSSPDVRFEILATDVRCKTTNTVCPGGALSDYVGRTLVTYQIRITDRNNGALGTDPATVQDISYNVPVDCTTTLSTTVGSTCNVLTRASAVLPGSVVGGKRAIWEITDVLLKDAGANGTGYGVGCPPTCGDGDEKVFMRQGVFVP